MTGPAELRHRARRWRYLAQVGFILATTSAAATGVLLAYQCIGAAGIMLGATLLALVGMRLSARHERGYLNAAESLEHALKNTRIYTSGLIMRDVQ